MLVWRELCWENLWEHWPVSVSSIIIYRMHLVHHSHCCKSPWIKQEQVELTKCIWVNSIINILNYLWFSCHNWTLLGDMYVIISDRIIRANILHFYFHKRVIWTFWILEYIYAYFCLKSKKKICFGFYLNFPKFVKIFQVHVASMEHLCIFTVPYSISIFCFTPRELFYCIPHYFIKWCILKWKVFLGCDFYHIKENLENSSMSC